MTGVAAAPGLERDWQLAAVTVYIRWQQKRICASGPKDRTLSFR